jgi:hypothetical protein
MSQTTKPTKNVNIYNPEYWESTGGLDIDYANSHYLKFPIGQGTETIPNLIVSGTATLGTTTARTIDATGNITAPTFVGNLISQTSSQLVKNVNLPPNILANTKEVIVYNQNTTITQANVNSQINGSVNQQQIYTFGQSIPPVMVATGAGTNTLAYSTDYGRTWTGVGSVFVIEAKAVCWNGEIWLAGGDNSSSTSSIAYSYDGKTWNLVDTGLMSKVYNIAWNGTVFVAVGSPSPTYSIIYSYNGINWFAGGTVFSSFGLGVVWNGEMFVAGGAGATNTLAYSYDGVSWVGLGKLVFTSDCYDIAWSGNMFVGVGVGTNPMNYSYDGLTWVSIGSPPLAEGRAIEWNGYQFVAVGVAGTSPICYSYNGINWISATTTIGVGYGIGWNGDAWIAGGTGANTLAISQDGIVWTGLGATTFSTISYQSFPNNSRCNTITIPTNRSVVGGQGTDALAYSDDDGANWIGLGTSIFTACRTVATNGRVWVAGGVGTFRLAWSANGKVWNGIQNSTNIFTTNCYSIIWDGTKFIAVGQSGGSGNNVLSYSFDGSNWFPVANSNPFLTAVFDIAYNGSIYVGVGSGGIIATSTTGISGWTRVATGLFTGDVLSIVWSGTKFVVMGTGTNQVAYSSDGVNWTASTSGNSVFTTAGRAIAWNGSIFVGGGYGANSLGYSFDAITWVGIGGSIFNVFCNGVFWNGTVFIGLGQNSALNTLAYSFDGINWVGLGATTLSSVGFSGSSNFGLSAVDIKQNIVLAGTNYPSETMWYSVNNGVNWTSMRNPTITTSCNGIMTNGSIWVAGGSGTNTLSYSRNGTNWIGLGTSIIATSATAIGWNGKRFVAVGSSNSTNNVAYSDDGVNWTSVGFVNSTTGWACVAGNSSGTWVIGGKISTNNTLAYSTNNGVSWTTLVAGGALPSAVLGLLWTGTKFIAVGFGSSQIYSSTNGSTWTSVANITNFLYCNCIATNGNIIVAGGQTGTRTLAYSSDGGTTWISVLPLLLSSSCLSICWTGTEFIAVGSVGVGTSVATSVDGITWVSRGLPFTSLYGGIAVMAGSGITPNNSLQLTTPNTKLDIVSPNYSNIGYTNFSVSIIST